MLGVLAVLESRWRLVLVVSAELAREKEIAWELTVEAGWAVAASVLVRQHVVSEWVVLEVATLVFQIFVVAAAEVQHRDLLTEARVHDLVVRTNLSSDRHCPRLVS